MLNYNIIRNIFCYFDNIGLTSSQTLNEKIRFLDHIFNIDDFDYAMKNWFKTFDDSSSIFNPIKSSLSGDFDYVDLLFNNNLSSPSYCACGHISLLNKHQQSISKDRINHICSGSR